MAAFNQSLLDNFLQFDSLSVVVVQITLGYFVYDLFDMLKTNKWNPM